MGRPLPRRPLPLLALAVGLLATAAGHAQPAGGKTSPRPGQHRPTAAKSAPAARTPAARTPVTSFEPLPAERADALLKAPARMDAESRRVLARVAATYGKLRSLETRAVRGRLVSVGKLQRPRLYHYVQKHKDGRLIGSTLCDGRSYYEHAERTRKYVVRDASILSRVTLPANVRLFFAEQKPDAVLYGLDGKPALREYAFRSLGRRAVDGKPADVIEVSVLVRGADGGWRSFTNTRFFDAKTSLLARMLLGREPITVSNRVNPSFPPSEFLWRTPRGATRSFN